MTKIYPLTTAVWEVVTARGDKSFSPVMVGQHWAIDQLKKLLPVVSQEGWQTSNLRQWLGLEKQKTQKGDAIPATHAVDGISLASSQFVGYRQLKGKQGWWFGSVTITPAPFAVIRRPPICRRQLHLMVPSKGGLRWFLSLSKGGNMAVLLLVTDSAHVITLKLKWLGVLFTVGLAAIPSVKFRLATSTGNA